MVVTGAVLFDLDGTLIDSATDIVQAADAAMVDCGVPSRGIERVRGFIGNGAERLIHRCLTNDHDGVASEDRFHEAYARFEIHYAQGLTDYSRPYPGVMTTLQQLYDAGYKLACVTNKPARFTEPLLARLGMSEFLTVTLSGDTLPTKKPDPAPLLHAIAACGVPLEASTMVGDSLADLYAARNAGMRVFCVTYGYADPAELARHAPDALIANMPEILDFLV